MKLFNGKTAENNKCFPNLPNTRRDFIKLCSAATLGGVSSLLLPCASEAEDSLGLLDTGVLQNADNELFWHFVRMQYVLQPGLIYMNTGTEGSMPRQVLKGLTRCFKEFAENPWDAVVGNDRFGALMKESRTEVAAFLGANFEEILMTTNTTEGMSYTANGLDLGEGDEVLLTLHEHSAGLCCWELLRERKGVTVTQLELPTPADNKDEIIAAFDDAITPQTKVMSFCHINYTTGLRMPVKELCQLAQDHGIISVVDGAHAIGMLDLDLDELGCDFYATSPHKWLNAPPGTGVLYMREGVQDILWPTVTEGAASRGGGVSVFQGRGQQCTPAYACISEALDFQNTIGKNRIEERILNLSTYLKDKIIENWGEEKLFSPTDVELSSGLVSFNPFDDPFDGEKIKIYKRLRDEYRIIIRTVNFQDRYSDIQKKKAMRVSTHIYNNYRQIDELISTLKALMADG